MRICFIRKVNTSHSCKEAEASPYSTLSVVMQTFVLGPRGSDSGDRVGSEVLRFHVSCAQNIKT